ncbi:MAG: glycosyltransferase family 9 protein [Opitutus sp.]
MSYPDPRPVRILVIRYRFIGDTVLAIPFLRNLRHAFPQAVIDILAEPISGDTLRHCPYKNELLYFAPRLKGPAKDGSKHPTTLLACAKLLRSRGYDRVYILRRSFSSAILPLLAGISHRVGFATEGRRWLLQRSTPYPDKHEVECFLDVLRADGIPVLDTYNENWSDRATDQRVEVKLSSTRRKRVFLCAKSVFALKDWSPERFAEVISWLVREQGCEIHFCDSPTNTGYYNAILDPLTAPVRDACTDWSNALSIAEVNSLIRRMDLALGIDTGLLHVAASFHVPVVALFGPLEPWRWHPWDTAHTVIRPADVSGPRPLLRVSVAEVQAAVEQHLGLSRAHAS